MENLGSTTPFCIIALLRNGGAHVPFTCDLRGYITDGDHLCLRPREQENKTVGRGEGC